MLEVLYNEKESGSKMSRNIFRRLKSASGFLFGFAVAFDIGATIYGRSRVCNTETDDYTALASDWAKTGEDLYKGLDLYREKIDINRKGETAEP